MIRFSLQFPLEEIEKNRQKLRENNTNKYRTRVKKMQSNSTVWNMHLIEQQYSLHNVATFALKISSGNVIKSVGNY